ncbi:MAG: galactose oxidase-like domain-containing protein [Thermoplasmatota archaeon]
MRWMVLLLMPLAGCLSDPGTANGEDAEPLDPGRAHATFSQTGVWGTPFEGEVPAVNMILLHDGRILYWSGVEAENTGSEADQVFFTDAPFAGESRILELTPTGFHITTPENALGGSGDLFCSGATILADGRVLAAGGSEFHNITEIDQWPLDGTLDARIFDPATDTWTPVADMVLGRWYPSLLTLPDGTPVAASGIETLSNPNDHWPNWESYDIEADRWDIMSGTNDQLLPLYPRLHVVPGGPMKGEAFYSTAATLWGPFGEHPEQAQWSFMQSYDTHDGTWHTHGLSSFGARDYASSILLPAHPANDYRTQVLSTGGTLQQGLLATPLTEIIDVGGAAPVTARGPDMAFARWNHQSVLLPDGDVLTIGGGLYDNVIVHGQQNIPVMETEIFDPETQTWRTAAAMDVPRMYHSSAVLLPDGRVLAGGHVPLPNPSETVRATVNPQPVETRLEIYEPGYLFRGARPVIDAAPEAVRYGETFTLEVRSPGAIDSVMLMHPGATTHAYDSGQRATWLEVVSVEGTTVTVTAPPDGDVSPPGHHMVFVNSAHAEGAVPSEAAWIHLS